MTNSDHIKEQGDATDSEAANHVHEAKWVLLSKKLGKKLPERQCHKDSNQARLNTEEEEPFVNAIRRPCVESGNLGKDEIHEHHAKLERYKAR